MRRPEAKELPIDPLIGRGPSCRPTGANVVDRPRAASPGGRQRCSSHWVRCDSAKTPFDQEVLTARKIGVLSDLRTYFSWRRSHKIFFPNRGSYEHLARSILSSTTPAVRSLPYAGAASKNRPVRTSIPQRRLRQKLLETFLVGKIQPSQQKCTIQRPREC